MAYGAQTGSAVLPHVALRKRIRRPRQQFYENKYRQQQISMLNKKALQLGFSLYYSVR